VVLLDIRINRIRNPDTDADVSVEGGIGSFNLTLTYPGGTSGNAINLMDVKNGPTFSTEALTLPHTSGSATIRGSLTGAATQAPLTLVRVAPRILGSANVNHTLTLSVDGLGAAGGNIAADGIKTYLLRRGDAKADGTITIADALFIAQSLAGLRETGEGLSLIHAINGANARQETTQTGEKLTIADALYIAQMLAGLRDASFGII